MLSFDLPNYLLYLKGKENKKESKTKESLNQQCMHAPPIDSAS